MSDRFVIEGGSDRISDEAIDSLACWLISVVIADEKNSSATSHDKESQMAKAVKWREDEKAIEVLDELGVEQECKVISAASIDVKKSRTNRARDYPVDEMQAKLYAEGMKTGGTFPAIVAWETSSNQYIIAGGNHRHEAAIIRLKNTQILAHVVRCTQQMFEIICRKLNIVEGVCSTHAQRISHAVDLVREQGMTVKDSSLVMRVDPKTLSTAVRREEFRDELIAEGIDGEKLVNASVDAIRIYKDQHAVCMELARCAIKSKLKGDQVVDLCKSLQAHDDEAGRMAAIKKASPAARKIPRPLVRKLNRALTSLESCLVNASAVRKQLDDKEAQEIQERWATMTRKMLVFAAPRKMMRPMPRRLK